MGTASAHATLRTTRSWLLLTLSGVVFMALLCVPAFARATGVSLGAGVAATTVVVVAVTLATFIYRVAGPGRLYYWADLAEGLATEWLCAFLMLHSGTVLHFVWLFYIFHVVLTAGVGTTLRNLLVIVSGPAMVAVAFALRGDTGAALVGSLGGIIGIAFYLVVGRMYDDLESSRQREATFKTRLAQLRVDQERTRIARDLHDGVAAELAALVWRARALAGSEGSEGTRGELQVFERRVLTALDELRDVVLGLRGEPVGWPQASSDLAARCRELCGDVAVDFEATGEVDTRTNVELWRQVQRIVFELVRNAARHAASNNVQVRLRADGGEGLRISVADDGRGIQNAAIEDSGGGLANIRARVEELAGAMTVASNAGGTRIEIALPMGARSLPA